MKKILMFFAAMAAVLSSCQKSELESVSANDGKDIVLNISVSNPGADDTKALIKTGWAVNDEISIWYDSYVQETPDLVVTYNGEKWIQKEGATVSGNIPSTGTGKYAKALYNGTVKVASKDDYTYENSTLTFNIANWKFLTEVQVVVKGLTSASADKYTLACDKFTPLASTGNGYTVGTDAITASAGTKGNAVTGISNTDGVAFVFASAEYSSSSTDKKDFTFTLKDNTSGSEVTKVYKPNVAIEAKTNNATIKALTIESSKFAVPVNPYVEIEADYDDDPSTPNTSLKWYRQNLAISDSGKKAWKGGNTSGAVKVPGTDKDVIVGDYFQWAASYAGYNITDDSKKIPANLLLYTSFDNKKCGDEKNQFYTDGGDFSKSFNVTNAPYSVDITYNKYNSSSPAILERTTTANDDVANIILGDNWRMPTTAEFQAMRAVTYWAWDATDFGYYVFMPNQGTSGAANAIGIFNTSSDDKTKALLFFPAAGSGSNTMLGINNNTPNGCYWSSSLETDNILKAYYLYFSYSSSKKTVSVNPQIVGYRYIGNSVRPVSE